MKVAYTGWTWIRDGGDPEKGKQQLRQSFVESKYVGYDYVENFSFIADYFKDDPQELSRMAQECGVEIVALYGHFNFDVEESVARAKKQIDFLAANKIGVFNCQNGGFGDEGPLERPSDYKMLDTTIEITNQVAKYAIERGVKLCFHPHYGTCVFSQADIDYFAARVNPEYVFFCFDTAHTTLAGINPAELVRQYGSRIAYMHLKDVNTYILSKTPMGRERMATFRALGHGTVDFPAVKAALEEVGYDGVLCVELDRPEVNNFHSAEVSRTYIKDVLSL